MAEGFDPRVTPARPDLAASHLKGKVDADRYADGTVMQVTTSVLPIRKAPAPDSMQETQMLFGDVFTVYEERDGWGWGQAASDNYVGYVDVEGLSTPVIEPTHTVSALRTYRFSEANLKSAPIGLISMNAQLTLGKEQNGFAHDARGGWVWLSHTAPIGEYAEDPVAVAETFLGAPYFWGGKESLGLDCSGLVQNAFVACGMAIPRDADMQEAYFTAPAHGQILWDSKNDQPCEDVALERGDLIFWAGHIGLMVDAAHFIHANATHMGVTIDPLADMAEKWATEKNLPVGRIIRPKG